MITEIQCDKYSDDQLRELTKLGPANTIGDTDARDVINKNLDGEKKVQQMRDHINHCLKCQDRIGQLAA